jgi:NAD-specific glutamate dehydrogenase
LSEKLARRGAALDRATYVADAAAVAGRVGLSVPQVIEAFVALDTAVAPELIKRLEAVRPRSRWSAWQARALIDDLVAWRPRAVTDALTSRSAGGPAPRGVDPLAAVAAWVAAHRAELSRVDELVSALDPEHEDVLSVAALLARALAATA